MALKTKTGRGDVKVNNTVKLVDTTGNNYLVTIPTGYRGATIMVTVNSGTATSFTVGKASNETRNDSTPTIIEYENGSITATGGDVAVNAGENTELYLVVAGASSLNADVEVDCFK